MALAEARAAWQRTANRCLVQEDAKRAPKLACSSSLPPSSKQADTEPTAAAGGQDIPTTCQEPFNQPSSCSNLSPNSRWWLHLQPNYGYQKCLTDNELNSVEVTGNCQTPKISGIDVPHVEEYDRIGQTKLFSTSPDDTEELASLVAQSSHGLIENCDLPIPRNACVKKNLNVDTNIYHFGIDKFVDLSVKQNRDTRVPEYINAHVYTQWGTNSGDFCRKRRLEGRGQLMPAEQLGPTSQRTPKSHMFENDPSKAELLEALRHSQTRAREAEKVAELAFAQKEHVVKLVFKQASQIFAYKQWLQLLQLENMYFQIKDNVHLSKSTIVPIVLPWTPLKSKKMRKSWQKPVANKRPKKARSRYDVRKYALVFALGLGLVGAAGLLLGWTVGWMLW